MQSFFSRRSKAASWVTPPQKDEGLPSLALTDYSPHVAADQDQGPSHEDTISTSQEGASPRSSHDKFCYLNALTPILPFLLKRLGAWSNKAFGSNALQKPTIDATVLLPRKYLPVCQHAPAVFTHVPKTALLQRSSLESYVLHVSPSAGI